MGDVRFERLLDHILRAGDRAATVRSLSEEQVIEALAAASNAHEPLVANVLATEATNRIRRLRAALAHLGEGVAALGLDGTLRWINPAGEKILGVERSAVVGRPFCELVGHRRALGATHGDRCAIMRAANGTTVARDDEQFLTSAGERVCVSYTSAPVLAPDGEPSGVVLAFQDCTARKDVEHELRVSEQRYRSLFANLPQGVISTDAEGNILDANGAAESLTQRPIGETRGTPIADYLHPDDLERVIDLFEAVVRGSAQRTRLRVLHKLGHYFEVDAIGIPITIDGQVVGIHGLLSEVG